MQFFFDLLPIFLFFLTYQVYNNLILATTVAIVTTSFQVIWFRWKHGKFGKVNVISFFSILVLGSATILLKNELFIKWKPTVVYWILGALLLSSHFFGKTPIIKRVAEHTFELPNHTWKQLNISWCIFFTTMGFLNLYVIYHYDTKTWVNFKMFGTLGLTLTFIIIQLCFIAKVIRMNKTN